jgi:hypothetical protein
MDQDFSYRYPIFLTLFVEKTILSLLHCFDIKLTVLISGLCSVAPVLKYLSKYIVSIQWFCSLLLRIKVAIVHKYHISVHFVYKWTLRDFLFFILTFFFKNQLWRQRLVFFRCYFPVSCQAHFRIKNIIISLIEIKICP